MKEDRPAKRILFGDPGQCDPGDARGTGRPKTRWEDGVDGVSKAIGTKNWKSVALNRQPGISN
jgi:hypothetical protein